MAWGSRKGAEKQKRFDGEEEEGGVMMRVTDSKTEEVVPFHVKRLYYIAPLHSYWAFA